MEYTIKTEVTKQSRIETLDFDNIPFGRAFSDHMFVADYIDGEWTNFTIQPYGDISFSPALMALHYGQAIFEGMKASINAQGEPLLFRPEEHAKRLNISAIRMGMPAFPEEAFVKALEQLVWLDRQWIPKRSDSALYLRPFMFASDEYIGVKPSNKYKMIIFTCPVGPYYSNPVKLLTANYYMRAVKGGVGFAKAAGNYAATLQPMKEANAQGYDQIMWMSPDFKYIQECGTMNLFFVIDGVVITPPTEDGTILKGITRDSFIAMLKAKGQQVEERPLSIDEVVEASKKRRHSTSDEGLRPVGTDRLGPKRRQDSQSHQRGYHRERGCVIKEAWNRLC
ncbi:MAG: branched-chain amino acid aminotransferase [Bacteroidota bacterium]